MTIFTFKLTDERFEEILYNYSSYDEISQIESDEYMKSLSQEERDDFFSDLKERKSYDDYLKY